MTIEGKVFIVTDGASGLGAGTARMLAANGCKVVVADMQAEEGEAAASSSNTMSAIRPMARLLWPWPRSWATWRVSHPIGCSGAHIIASADLTDLSRVVTDVPIGVPLTLIDFFRASSMRRTSAASPWRSRCLAAGSRVRCGSKCTSLSVRPERGKRGEASPGVIKKQCGMGSLFSQIWVSLSH